MEDEDGGGDHDLLAEEPNPIIEAIVSYQMPDFIVAIIDERPDMVRRRNRHGHLPIHCALERGGSDPRIVRRLLRSWPESAREPMDAAATRQLPAHLACQRALDLSGAAPAAVAEAAAKQALVVVKAVVRAHPAALSAADAKGRLPLHAAFQGGTPPLDVVQYLVRKHRNAVRVTDSDGFLPLHHALYYSRSPPSLLPAAKLMVEAWPQSVQVRASYCDTPMFLAVEASLPLDFVEFLDKAGPDAIRSTSHMGETVLHAAARKNNVPLAKFVVSRWPDSVRQPSSCGSLPVHAAAVAGSVNAMRLLVGNWRESVQALSKDGWLPIHEAARHGNIDAVRYLVRQRPSSVREKGHGGCLPIHSAARCRPWDRRRLAGALDVVRFLVGQNPRAVWATDDKGCLPIHHAAGHGSFLRGMADRNGNANDDYYEGWRRAATETELRIVRFLARQAPASLRIMSGDGKLPVHYAIEEGLSLSTVEHLWGRWPAEEGSPESVQFRTGDGVSALHLAAARALPSLEHVEFVVRLQPQMLLEVDPDGRLPVHYAAACKHHCLDVCRFLVDQNPESLRHAANDGSLPLHACVNRREPLLEKVQYFVGQNPRALQMKDSKGSLPLHVALSQFKVSPELVEFMVEQDPRSLRQKNGLGLLPLHIAAAHDAALDVLYYLASKDPGSVCMERPSNELPRLRPRKRRKPN